LTQNFPNIIIDTSYLIYYTAFSTHSWYKSEFHWEHIQGHQFKPTEDDEWQKMFKYRFKYNIQKPITKKFPFIDLSRIYFAIDCPKREIWRNELLQSYKITRKQEPKEENEIDIGDMFKFVYNDALPEFIDKHKCTKVSSPGAEGDDIIAILVKEFDKFTNIILASDKDLIQLLDTPNNHIITIPGKEYELEDDLTSKQFVILKALMGDKGDDVPQLFPRCGRKTALKYLKDPVGLKQKLTESKELEWRFRNNLKLVDFSYIPDIIRNDVKKQLEIDSNLNWSNL
jgi:5'-3' exonuclease